MSQCNALYFQILWDYYSVAWEKKCCWSQPTDTYEQFLTGVSATYDYQCVRDRTFSTYVSRLYNDCASAATSGVSGVYVTGGTANGSDSTVIFTNSSGGTFTLANGALLFNDAYVSGGTLNGATGVVTFVNTTGGTFDVSGFDGFTSYWSANTDGSISPSGLTTSIGIGTSTPNVDLTIAGSLSATGVSSFGSIDISGQYIRYGGTGGSGTVNRINISNGSTPNQLVHDWQLEDSDHLYFGTGEDLDIYHSGTASFIDNDTGSLYVTSSALYLGDTTSETTVQNNLSVGDDLTVNTNTLYVNSTGNTVGINTKNQDAVLTVSGITGTSWTAWSDGSMTAIQFTQGATFLAYAPTTLTVPGPLQVNGTAVRVLVGSTYYYGTTTGVNFINGRGYFGLTWSPASITLTSGLDSVISYGGVDVNEKTLKVYRGTDPIFQVSGTSVMSGSTDLLDIFATSGITNQDVYWSASTGGISNSGLTGNVGIGTTTPNEKLTVAGAISGTTDLYIGDNIRGLRGQFGNLPSAAGANRDLEIKGDDNVYLRLQSTTNANQTIEFMNDQEPDFLIYNKHTDGGLYIASDDKTFLVIGANDADTIDLYGNTIISGNTTLSGNTSYSGTISGTGSVTAVGGFVGDLTGQADTVATIAGLAPNTAPTGTFLLPATAAAQGNITSLGTLTGLAVAGSIDLNATLLDIDASTGVAIDGPLIAISASTTCSINNANTTNGITIGTTKASVPISIGHLTSETTVNDNFTVRGDATIPTRKYELPSSTVGDFRGGDIYYYGNGSTVKGSIYYINGTNWTLADADLVASSTVLLAVALGTDPDVDGMLLRGFVTLLTEVEGTEAIGSVLYLSATDTGIATTTAPSGSGDVVRVIGYSLHATENQIYFNPDNTWVELSS